uniref:Polyprotein protein n=1 Tax=Solanum tuberosum TaxID=4113 RepID=M1D8G2_SOLTU
MALKRLKAAGERMILEERQLSIDGFMRGYPAISDTIQFHRFGGFTKPQFPYAPAKAMIYQMGNFTRSTDMRCTKVESYMTKLMDGAIKVALAFLRVRLTQCEATLVSHGDKFDNLIAKMESRENIEPSVDGTTFSANIDDVVDIDEDERDEDRSDDDFVEETNAEEIQRDEDEQQIAMTLTEL